MKIAGDLQSTGDITALRFGITFTDGVNAHTLVEKVNFSDSNFYLTTSGGQDDRPVVNLKHSTLKSITLEYPGAAENTMMFFAPRAMRIIGASAVVVGSSSPSVTFSMKSGTDRSSLGVTHTTSVAVTNTTTGTALAISTALIPANSWVCLVSTAQSGTVTEIDVNLRVEDV